MKGLLVAFGSVLITIFVSCSDVEPDLEVTIKRAKLENCGEVVAILKPLIETGNRAVRINGHLYNAGLFEFHPAHFQQERPAFNLLEFFDRIEESPKSAWKGESGIVLKMKLSPSESAATFFRLLDICEEREWKYQFIESEGDSSVEVWALAKGRLENSPL